MSAAVARTLGAFGYEHVGVPPTANVISQGTPLGAQVLVEQQQFQVLSHWPVAAITLGPETEANAERPWSHGFNCSQMKAVTEPGFEIAVPVEQLWLWGPARAQGFKGQLWSQDGKTALRRPHSSVFSLGGL